MMRIHAASAGGVPRTVHSSGGVNLGTTPTLLLYSKVIV
jgi:hypothetical protein